MSATEVESACKSELLHESALPSEDHPDHAEASRALLRDIDLSYADLLAAEHATPASKRSPETQCLLDRYRTVAAELEPIRQSTRTDYERAVAALRAEEQIASSLCLPYEFGGRAWKKCERAAAAHRAKLRARLRTAQRAWSRIDNPPDYRSDAGDTYWVSRRELAERVRALDRADRAVQPRHVGPEVWCGQSNLRRAESLLKPEHEFMRVTEKIDSSALHLQNYRERYAQAVELERESIERLDRPIRARVVRMRLAKLEEIRSALEGWRCQASWSETRARELSDVPNAAEIAYRDAKDAFERLETQCDAHRPERKDWTLDVARSAPWIECLKAAEVVREEKRHALEAKKSLHEATRAAASDFARNMRR